MFFYENLCCGCFSVKIEFMWFLIKMLFNVDDKVFLVVRIFMFGVIMKLKGMI